MDQARKILGQAAAIDLKRGPAGDEVLAAAHLGQDGLYRDESGAPIARAVGGSVVIDPDAVRAAITPREKQQDDAGAKACARRKQKPSARSRNVVPLQSSPGRQS